jgi:DNA-binding MarR family transcriptional regulator
MRKGGREPAMPAGLITEPIGWLLYTAGQEIVRDLEDELKGNAVSRRDYGVLGVLEADGPISQQAIGRKLAIDRSTMVHLIDDLERRGLVARGRDRLDRRAYAVELTDAGRALLIEVLHPATAMVYRRLVDRLTNEDRAHLSRILERLSRRP